MCLHPDAVFETAECCCNTSLQAVLEESEQCPFTKQPLKVAQLKRLSHTNIDLYRDKIVK